MGPLSLIRRYGVNPYDLPQDEDADEAPPAPPDQGAPQLVAAANAPAVSPWGAASIPASASMMGSPPAPSPAALPSGGGPGGPSVLPSGLINRTGQTIGGTPSAPAPKPQPQSARIAGVGNPPAPPKENFFQTLARMLLTPKLGADQANAMVHPKWTAQEQQYETDLKNAVQQDTAEALVSQREANTALKNAQAERQGQLHDERTAANTQRIRDSFLKSLGPNAVPLNPGETAPQGWATWSDPTDPSMHYARPGGFIPLPQGMEEWFPGMKAGDPVSMDQYNAALKGVQQRLVAQGKPVKQSDQERYIALLQQQKTNPGSITPQDQAFMDAWRQNTKEQKTDPGVLRAQVFAGSRMYNVIDKNTGQMVMKSAEDIAANPEQYAGAAQAQAAMTKESVFSDLHKNIEYARNALNALNTMDAGTRARLSYALRATDPSSAFQSFMTGTVGGSMTPEQMEAAQSLAILNENAMALRGLAGFGQGSDELRAAIRATLPSGASPTKGYALEQLSKFEQIVNRLETGVPHVINPPKIAAQTQTPYNVGDTVMYQGRPHKVTAIQNGKLVLAP